ncbi:MAG: hypothetical protein AVDCRST_MAG87-3899, partial [uncultured Thermomicrobiales bacterium]
GCAVRLDRAEHRQQRTIEQIAMALRDHDRDAFPV